jgi:hypothetical protein
MLRSAETHVPCVSPSSENGYTESVFSSHWLYRIGQLNYCFKNYLELDECGNEGGLNEIAYDEIEMLGCKNSEGEE